MRNTVWVFQFDKWVKGGRQFAVDALMSSSYVKVGGESNADGEGLSRSNSQTRPTDKVANEQAAERSMELVTLVHQHGKAKVWTEVLELLECSMECSMERSIV